MTDSLSMHLPQADSRHYFLDWLRILAFFVLILYHVGMYYVTWEFHIKSVNPSHAIEPLMMLSSPWRLSLLFMISGVASRFLLDKLSTAQFLKQRSARLLIPLVFGMTVIVPPQSYCEVIEKLAYAGSYLDFLKLYFKAYHGFCRGNESCLILPTWNHLWFVIYLWCYTVALAALMFIFRQKVEHVGLYLNDHLRGWKLLLAPLLVLAVIRISLLTAFPTTHALVDDWFEHANYFFLFFLGALLAKQKRCWSEMDAMRWPAFALGLSCWAALIIYFALPDNQIPAEQVIFWRDVQRVVYALCEWSCIVAVCGFAHRHLQFDSPQLRYLTQAVFPLYILHQTIIVVLAHSIKPAQLPAPLEGLILVILTFSLSFAGFAIVRRIRVLRPLFGLSL